MDSNQWLTSLSRIENQVCRIEIETDQGKTLYGTGFLISSNALVTNYHVMEALILGEAGQTTEDGFSAKSSNVKCRFDYKRLGNKVLNSGTVYQLDNNWQIDISPNSPLDKLSLTQTECLDYAIIRLAGEPGNEFVASKNASSGENRGWIKLPENIVNDDFLPNSPLFIMQHPQGQPLKLALDTNAIIGLTDDKTRLRYRTNTEPGSSGSPCFNQKLELIALHHSGDPNFDYDHKPTYNEGIPFSAITALLKKRNISFDGGDVKPTNSDSNKAQNNPITSQHPSKETIKPTTTQSTENQITHSISNKSNNTSNITIVNQQILSFRPGAIKTTIIAFIIINGVKDIGGIESAELLTKLHSSIKSLINKQTLLNVPVLSNLLGAIILFPNSAQFEPLDSIKLIIELNNEMASNSIAIKVGMSLGDVQELIDIDGKANFIGVCINQAARLATTKMDNHPGLLIHESLASHLQASLRANHWLSGKNSNRLFVEVSGKREEKFLCYYPPTNIWPSLPNITYSYDESFHPETKNAALIAYDLPNFSDGDLNQLSQRFRAISDVFLTLVAETKLPLKYFYFSPGGDGGVMVFTDLEKKPVYDLAKNFAEKLLIESENKSSLISSECRIGLHYGTILLYENAQGDLRPTGDDIFIADAITGDDAAKQADKLIFTQPLIEAVGGGATSYFVNNFYSLPILKIFGREIKRYAAKTNNSYKGQTEPQPIKSNVKDNQALKEAFFTSSINILEKLAKEEYNINLTQLINQFDINQQKTILQFTRLLGVMLKEPFSINYDMQPSERTGAIRGWQWDVAKFLLPNVQGHWQYKVIEALYKESYSQSSITQEIKITAIQQFISHQGSSEGRMSLILLESIENYICRNTTVKAQIEEALQASSASYTSIIPTAIGLSLCSIIANAVPYGSSLGPLVGGIAILLSKIGLDVFCNWVKQHAKSETLRQAEQTEQKHTYQPSKADKSNQNNNPLFSILKDRKQDLIDEIAAAYKQLGTSLSEVDKTRINRLIKDLENELAQIQSKLDSSTNVASQNQSQPKISIKPNQKAISMDRKTLFNQLTTLVLADFEKLLFVINPNRGFIPHRSSPQAERVSALLEWAESPTGCGLDKVQETFQTILNPLLEISQSSSKVEQLVNPLILEQNIQNYQASPSSNNNLPANNNALPNNQIIDNSSNKGNIHNMVNPLVNNLKEQISRKKVFLFIGTGVSISASGNTPVASWKGLLKNGAELCSNLCNDLPNRWKERVLEDIESSDIIDLLSAAEKIQIKLKSLGGQYSRWLRETVGQLQIVDPNILNAIKALDLPIITTNYDDLLEKALGLREITWMDERKIDRFFQGEEKGIFHLHGHWDHPESVILGIRDYQNILNAHIAQSFMQSLRLGGTLLFIGYGAGLQDPNFKAFLDYGTTTLHLSESQHYRLIKEDELSSFATHHPNGSGIFPIVYGSSHNDLVPFLRSLNP